MKRLFCSITFLSALTISILAQNSSFKNCTLHYFSMSTSISTSICFDEQKRWGEAKAFDKSGKEIYKRQLRKIAGHATVQFKYYESGMVKEAYYSSAPDAGIQWYHETIIFDEHGKITDERKESHEDLISPRLHPNVLEKPIKQIVTPNTTPDKKDSNKTSEGAIVYSNEIWITNSSAYTVVIEAKPIKADGIPNKITLKKGEKKRLTVYGNAYSEEIPEDYFKLSAFIPASKSSNRKIRPRVIKFKSKSTKNYLSRFDYVIQ